MSAIDASLNGNSAWDTSTQDGSTSCIALDGASWLETGHDAKLDFTNSFVVAIRVKRNGSQSNAYVLSKLQNSGFTNCWDVIYGFAPDTFEFHTNGASGSNPRTGSGVVITDDDWHSLAYRYDGARWSVIVDGTEQLISASISFSLSTASLYGLIFGSLDGASFFFTGSIDDVRVWNGTIPSVADLEAWTASPFTSPSATARGRWAMDENTGTVAADSGSDPAPPSSGSIVSLTASTNSIAEGGGTVTITALMDATASATVTVTVGFAGAAATGSDYTVSTNTITIASGQTSGSLTATAIDDSVYEGNEQFTASITSVTGGGASASSTASTLVVTIVDDEVAPVVNLSASATSIVESLATVYVIARLANASTQNVTVNFGFSGSATLNTDYSASSNSLIVAAGNTSGSISVTAIQDTTYEGNETILVGITSVTNGSSGATSSLSITLAEDDPVPPTANLSASTTSIVENGGSAIVNALLSSTWSSQVTVSLTFAGSATNAVDYTRTTTTIVIPSGQTRGTVSVTSLDDAASEGNETILVSIASVAGGASSSSDTLAIFIVDDEAPVGAGAMSGMSGMNSCFCDGGY